MSALHHIFFPLVILLAAGCHRSSDDSAGGVVGPPATGDLELEIAPNFAWVSWSTGLVQHGIVQWGLTDSYGDEASEPSPGLDHRVLMSGLDPLTTYYYRVGFDGPTGRVYGVGRTFISKRHEPHYSDDFNYPNLDLNRWTLVDPQGQGSLKMEGAGSGEAGVRLTTPAWVDYSVDGESRALRLMQDMGSGPFGNVVKLSAAIDCPGESCGTLWAQDEENFVRFGLDYNSGDVLLTAVVTEAGVAGPSMSMLVNFGSWFGEFPLYLRVIHQGDIWFADWSYDGQAWQLGLQFQHALDVETGGLYVSSEEGLAAGVSLLADYFFTLDYPIVPEDQSVRIDRTEPYIYRLDPEVLSERSIRLGWFTDEPCEGGLDWGVAPDFEFHERVEGLEYSQSVTISELEGQTDYVLRARAVDAAGRESISEEVELETEDG